MPDLRTDQQKFRRLVAVAAQAQSLYGDDELEWFAEEYWAKRGINYQELHKYTLKHLFALKEVDNGKST